VLWGVSGATQHAARGDPSHPTPTEAGRGGGAPWHPVLALGQAAGPRLWAGYDHLSVLPPWHAPAHFGSELLADATGRAAALGQGEVGSSDAWDGLGFVESGVTPANRSGSELNHRTTFCRGPSGILSAGEGDHQTTPPFPCMRRLARSDTFRHPGSAGRHGSF